jgi:histidine triad (HIT) family protein
MPDCIFCRIVAGEIPSTKVFEDERYCAFRDINPKSPVHFLVITREHIDGVADMEGREELLGGLVTTGVRLAAELGLADAGYRLVLNQGADGGQSVPHVHLHVLGGRALAWPPG